MVEGLILSLSIAVALVSLYKAILAVLQKSNA